MLVKNELLLTLASKKHSFRLVLESAFYEHVLDVKGIHPIYDVLAICMKVDDL